MLNRFQGVIWPIRSISAARKLIGEDSSRNNTCQSKIHLDTMGAATLEVAESAPEGSNILCMLPDTGERYLSTPLFENIEIEMTEDEKELSASTPSCQF